MIGFPKDPALWWVQGNALALPSAPGVDGIMCQISYSASRECVSIRSPNAEDAMVSFKPTMRTEAEVKAQKAQELHERGLKKSEIAEAMGLKSKSVVKDLLQQAEATAQK
jgi:hypothetical protein